MKTKFWSVYAMMLSTGLLAQQVTNPPPAAPVESPAPAPAVTAAAPATEPATNAPAAPASAPKPAAPKPAKKATELRSVPLVPGIAVVTANRVNVRGKAGLKGEVITRMTNGEPVTVIEEITLKKSGPEEPSAWAKILLPAKANPWVHSSYIDATTKAVKPKKLNLRSGPGENYSVLGTLQRGDVVKEMLTKGDWMQIESSTNTYAFMAAQYLSQEPAALAAAGLGGTSVAASAEPTAVAETAAAAEASTAAPVLSEGMAEAAAAAATETPSEPVQEGPPPPRIVQREGVVRYTGSIQAPTIFQLISMDTRKPINYLYTTSTNLNLNRYKGMHIVVTGEEGLDERWKSTPIITIHRIQVIE